MTEQIKKKRGRKPKHLINNLTKPDVIPEESCKSEEDNIIFHLPINMDEINNSNDMSIFIKSEEQPKNYSDSPESIKQVETKNDVEIKSERRTEINILSNSVNKISTYIFNFTSNTKCWWCRNTFTTCSIQLPEDYYNDTFFCIGNFCSFNCMKAYNLDLNDTLTWRRESLINLLYYQTYKEYNKINPAPHWMTLQEYGGNLTINEFRKNSLINDKEFLVLRPPLISRQMHIEESYKLNKLREVPIDKLNKKYSENESELSIRRNGPVASSQMNLETTMGLIKLRKK